MRCCGNCIYGEYKIIPAKSEKVGMMSDKVNAAYELNCKHYPGMQKWWMCCKDKWENDKHDFENRSMG